MKQLLLATALVILPAAAFLTLRSHQPEIAAPLIVGLGNLTPFQTIVADVRSIAETGDLGRAEKRITDFETAWDDAATTLRARDARGWGGVDDAADAAMAALRSDIPVKASVIATLGALQTALQMPVATLGSDGPLTLIAGIAVTDVAGHAIPCEEMLKSLSAVIAEGKIAATDQAKAAELQLKATERCNADDDKRANDLSAQGLALAAQ
jgi:hypothetical protein